MRPVVKTALRRLWRDPTTLQIGVRADRALVVGGVGAATAQLVDAIDGTRDGHALRATARSLGLDTAVADRLLDLLTQAAVLDDAATARDAVTGLSPAEQDRLAPDLASMSLVSGRPDGGLSALARRRAAKVRIVGAGRVGASVATALAAAGVGHVAVDDPAACRPADCGPAGATPADVGASRAAATRAAIHRVSSTTRTDPLAPDERADAAVLAPSGALDPLVCDELLRSAVPHVVAQIREVSGIVGPFVFPGRSACLRCLDLHRTDRDPAWPLIAAQLAVQGRRPIVDACDVGLAMLIGSMCAMQVLAVLDGGTAAAEGGTLEITLPDWRVRRRSWHPHPACGCGWDASLVAAGLLEQEPAGSPDRAERHREATSRTMEP